MNWSKEGRDIVFFKPKESLHELRISIDKYKDVLGHYYSVGIVGRNLKTGFITFTSMVGENNIFGFRRKSDAKKLFDKTIRDLKAGVPYQSLLFKGSRSAKIKEVMVKGHKRKKRR